MFFFGGYSSILPYLLYLGIVWVCVLIGAKGDVWNSLNEGYDADQKIIGDILPPIYSEAYAFSINNKNVDNRAIFQVTKALLNLSLFAFQGRTRLLCLNKRIIWCQQTALIASISFRGPPLLSF